MIKIKIDNTKQKFNINHRLEKHIGLDKIYHVYDMQFNNIVDCRLYFTSNFISATCCLWVYDNKNYKNSTQGSGKAGGYGYCKQSAAVADAIENAGIEIDRNISGVGLQAVEEVLIAIAKKISGKRKVKLIACYA